MTDGARCLQVRAGYCKLSWDAPEDDGGTPISQYVVNMMDLTVNEWVAAAETKDKSAEVKCLKPGHLYRFEVFAVNKEGKSPAARLKDPVKAENPYTTPGVPTDVNIVDFDEVRPVVNSLIKLIVRHSVATIKHIELFLELCDTAMEQAEQRRRPAHRPLHHPEEGRVRRLVRGSGHQRRQLLRHHRRAGGQGAGPEVRRGSSLNCELRSG